MAEAPTKTPITMTDGRTVEFTTKQKLAKDSTVNEDGSVSTRLDFRNGETRTFSIAAANPLFARFAAHGIEQKLGDAIAGEPDLDDAVLSVDDLITRLNAGEWNVGRAGGGGGFSGASVLFRALCELKGADTDEAKQKIKDFLGSKTQAEKVALRRMDQLAPIVARIEADKAKNAKSSVDTSALLGELDSIGSEASEPQAEITAKTRKSVE